jgi:hypothetical protein
LGTRPPGTVNHLNRVGFETDSFVCCQPEQCVEDSDRTAISACRRPEDLYLCIGDCSENPLVHQPRLRRAVASIARDASDQDRDARIASMPLFPRADRPRAVKL